MLRNVCDGCGSVIDGEPVQKDYPEAILLIDDEVAVMYENLCNTCKKELRDSVARFASKRQEERESLAIKLMNSAEHIVSGTVTPKSPQVFDKAVPNNGNGENPPLNPVTSDDRELANKVVKQFPIKLPKHED